MKELTFLFTRRRCQRIMILTISLLFPLGWHQAEVGTLILKESKFDAEPPIEFTYHTADRREYALNVTESNRLANASIKSTIKSQSPPLGVANHSDDKIVKKPNPIRQPKKSNIGSEQRYNAAKKGTTLPKNGKGKKTQPMSLQRKKATFQVSRTDFIYRKNSWDGAPIVLEEFKLIFFTIPKVACTVWKQLFRRMMGYEDWKAQSTKRRASLQPHNPRVNGLKYLYHYSLEEATRLMASPEYTRAIFVRDPKERFVSAYLDKALSSGGNHLVDACCPNRSCIRGAQSITGFLNLARNCHDDHWRPQSQRLEKQYWPFINFVGYYSHRGRDARLLLEHVGAWEKFGKSGWGRHGNSSIFTSLHGISHTTGAANQVWRYIYSTEIERQIEEYYAEDYANPRLNLTKKSIFSRTPRSANVSTAFQM